eukprot:TRINITY_DN21331_c0_g1_i2.p2 TRINITY_DN21331_c0_g1~~TRINITY_DN21331_c0_g1_i2.p2  ORF type:complete len:189 (+),score=38.81 TRINITY_DN21331_c0_g1_i2:149-715(+)
MKRSAHNDVDELAENVRCQVASISLSNAATSPEAAEDMATQVATAQERLKWYDQLLLFVKRHEDNCLDWKAWASCGACLHRLGEKKASWDSYRQAALAYRLFRQDLTDEDVLGDEQVGKYLRALDKEFKTDGWMSNTNDDVMLFALLVQHGRASEIAVREWHVIMPNHFFSVMQHLSIKVWRFSSMTG